MWSGVYRFGGQMGDKILHGLINKSLRIQNHIILIIEIISLTCRGSST